MNVFIVDLCLHGFPGLISVTHSSIQIKKLTLSVKINFRFVPASNLFNFIAITGDKFDLYLQLKFDVVYASNLVLSWYSNGVAFSELSMSLCNNQT